MHNPYPYSLDNKRYCTWNWYARTRYGAKIAKVPLDAGFTCPTRDGTKGTGGCLFCPSGGAGSFPLAPQKDLMEQFSCRLALLRRKWPDALGVPYFQAYSNTYAPLEKLEEVYLPFVIDPSFPLLFLATRPDCLDENVLALLSRWNRRKQIWVEIGVQSARDETTAAMRCGYTFAQASCAARNLHRRGIRVSVHLINGLPGETGEDMIRSAKKIASLPVDAVKFHALLILRDSPLASAYEKSPFPLLTRAEYLDILIRQLEVLPPKMVIERAASDAPEEELIAPLWPRKKTVTLNELDEEMARRDTFQGRLYEAAERQ